MLHLIRLEGVSIFEQLALEEALLRADDRFFCIINTNSSPAIVMGISSKKELVVDEERSLAMGIPLIRRFSGGGTVVVDSNTCFVTWIGKPSIAALTPDAVHAFAAGFYEKVFGEEFALRENDYVFGSRKFGGNAQYFRKDRWLHHTSFLWDYEKDRMACLKYPPKTPEYRKARQHEEFLCCLNEQFFSKNHFIDHLEQQILKLFPTKKIGLEEVQEVLERPHRKALKEETCLEGIAETLNQP